VLLAELEVRHSRPVAPTRRVALGQLWLPANPAPGFGGLLLAGLVGALAPQLDEDLRDALDVLISDLERSKRIAQPRLRYRFQTDTVGLDRSRHRLTGHGEGTSLEVDDHSAPLPQVLAAVYAASRLSMRSRPAVFRLLHRATRWQGEDRDRLLSYLSDDGARALGFAQNEGWALAVLGFAPDSEPGRSEVQRRFRRLVRIAHPDHGGSAQRAGSRILELTRARRILVTAR